MKLDLVKQFNLPSYIKGKSLAEAHKLMRKRILGEKGERENNKEAVSTFTEMSERLKQAQEFIKAQEEENKAMAEFPTGEQFNFGGFIDPDPTEPSPNVNAAMATANQGKYNTANPETLSQISEQLRGNSPTYTNEQLARFNKVQEHGGSFDPSLNFINEDVGHVFKPLEKHTRLREKYNRMRDGSKKKELLKKLDRDVAIYKQQMGNKARVADYMMGVDQSTEFAYGGYKDQNKFFAGGSTAGAGNASTPVTGGTNPNQGTRPSKDTGSTLGNTLGSVFGNTAKPDQGVVSGKEAEMAGLWEQSKDAASNYNAWMKAGRAVEQAGVGLGNQVSEGTGDFMKGFLDPMSNKTRKDYNMGEKVMAIDPVTSGVMATFKNRDRRDKAIAVNEEASYLINRDNEYAKGGKMTNDYFFGGLFGKGGQGMTGEEMAFMKDKGTASAGGKGLLGKAGGGGKGPGVMGYLGAAQEAYSIGDTVFGKGPKYVDPDAKLQSTGGAAATGAMKGAQAGMAFGPWGAAIGGVLGAAGGIIGSGKKRKAQNKALTTRDLKSYNDKMEEYAYGGKINKYDTGGPFDFIDLEKLKAGVPNITGSSADYHPEGTRGHKLSPSTRFDRDRLITGRAESGTEESKILSSPKGRIGTEEFRITRDPGSRSSLSEEEIMRAGGSDSLGDKKGDSKKGKGKVGDFAKRAGKDLLRYSPAIMNAIQYMNAKRPERETLAKMDNRYKPSYIDERALMNAVNQGFNPDSATEAAGGSLSRLATLNRANQAQKSKAMSDAYFKAQMANAGEDRAKQQFDSNIDRFNVGVRHKEAENYARDLGAYNTERSRLLGAIGENLGDLGTEMSRSDMIKEMYDYDRYGRYIGRTNTAAKGGKLDSVFDYIKESYMNRFKNK